MKIIFVTNLILFHQTGVWDSFCRFLSPNDEFFYLSTSPMHEERINMGYTEEDRPYIVKSYELDDDSLRKLFENLDVVIVGSIEDKRVKKYLWKAKYYITASEHIRKKKNIRSFISLAKHMLKIYFHGGYKNKYLIAYSSIIGDEYRTFGFNKEHIFKFGYFPSLPTIEDENLIKKDPYQLCFCARLLPWKRPMFAIRILEEFLKYDSRYHLVMIGEGSEERNVIDYVKKRDLYKNFEIISFQSHDKILSIMKKSSFYLFTSTKEEGWGVVLNEAMSQGCIPISSIFAGSTKFLVENQISGYIYSDDCEIETIIKQLFEKTKQQIRNIQIKSRNAIKDLWNCNVAGERLYTLINAIVNNEPIPEYDFGPISRV